MNYNFDTSVAKEYGVNEAIMIANFQFWIKKNKANGDNFYDGHYWTYNSISAFKELFPFWTEQNIKTILKHLKEKGILISGNYNENKYNHTNWYAFLDEEKWIGYNQPNDKLELTNQVVRTKQSNTYIKPYIKPYIKENTNQTAGLGDGDESKNSVDTLERKNNFELFWKEYPKQRAGSKTKAFSSYCRAIKEKRCTPEKLLEVCVKYAQSDEVKRGYAKGCAAWLNDDRFNVEYNQSKQQFEW